MQLALRQGVLSQGLSLWVKTGGASVSAVLVLNQAPYGVKAAPYTLFLLSGPRG